MMQAHALNASHRFRSRSAASSVRTEVPSWSAVVAGVSRPITAAPAKASTPRATKGPRQPASRPAHVPIGTPITLASVNPPITTPIARDRRPAPAAWPATMAATAQNAPVARAVSTRAASRMMKLELSAATTCPAAKISSASVSTEPCGSRRVASAITGEPTIIPTANAVIRRPERASLTCRPSAMSGSSPAIMNSVVPIRKVPAARMYTTRGSRFERVFIGSVSLLMRRPRCHGIAAGERTAASRYWQGTPALGVRAYPAGMDLRGEIRDFLTSRRARITLQDAGLKVFGPRRVPGLRREEVATLAGLSVDYYNRMERGNLAGASDSVLEAVADALRLDEAERAHLRDLARASQPSARGRRRSATPTIRPSVQWMLDSMTASAAFAENGRLDALGANRLGRALYPAVFSEGPHSGNWARFIFFSPEARSLFADWDRAAKDSVAILRSEAGRSPHDRELTDLVGELATQSEEFRGLWAAHNVRLHTKGVKRFNHPIAGELELSFNRLEVTADPGLMLVVYSAEPGSRSAEAFGLLASWAASDEFSAPERSIGP